MLPRLAGAVRWQISKRLFATSRELKLANGAKFVAHPDCVVSSALIYADWPEYHELQFVRRRLTAQDVVIDIGANVGHVSLLLSDIVTEKNIFAFEPTPVTYSRLKKNWEKNNWATDQLFQVALGDETGEIDIPDVTHPDTKNSVCGNRSADTPVVSTPLRPLDSFRDQWKGRQLGLLKIDVEGFEAQVFAGAIKTLRDDRPQLLMFESLAEEPPQAIRDAFDRADYRIFQLDDNGRPDLTRQNSQNLFAIPAELTETLTTTLKAA